MLATMRRPVNRGQRSTAQTFPSPTGGWNVRDPIADMGVNYAVRLDNWFPSFGRVSIRKGYTSYATGLGDSVKTLKEFNAGSSRKFIAAANGKIWDVSSAGAAVQLATGFTNDAWQCAQFDDAGGGARLGMVNGADAPQIYNGATVGAMTVSGPTIANLVGIHIHKNKSYFWEANSQSFWYSATSALGGVLTEFKLGRLSGFGGNLVKMDTWSVDAGNGPDDLAVFLMSSGDVIVYAGSDPGSVTTWSLVGVYRIGAPIGNRPTIKIGAELYAITKNGFQPMSQVAKLGLTKQSVVLSDTIRGAVTLAADSGASLGGWEAVLYPKGNRAIFNVPQSTTVFHQYVVNTETGAWCRFNSHNGYAWALYNDALYFGGVDGKVYKADDGYSDNGTAIQADAICSWNYLGAPGRLKNMGLARVLGETTNATSIPYSLGLAVDFREVVATLYGAVPATASAPWDSSAWDTTAWPSESSIFDSWGGALGVGDAVSARLRMASTATGFDWFTTTYIFEPGGLL